MSASTLRRIGGSLLVLVWLAVVVTAYYAFHPPLLADRLVAIPSVLGSSFGADLTVTLAAFANVLGDAGTIIILIVLAAVLGHRLGAAWTFDTPLESVVMWTGIGLGAVAFAVFALAALGIVNQWVYWALVLLTLALLRHDVRDIWQAVRTLSLPRPTRVERALALFTALALVLTFLFALTPPWGWDGLQYHLVLPKLALEQGRLSPPPDNPALSFPGLVEMLFLAAMTLKGDGAAQGLHWVFLPLVCGAILTFARKYFSWRIGWLAVALFCAVPTIVLLATWAYNDLALAFYTFTAFVFALRARNTGATRDFVLVGILCGLALGEKLTAFFVPLTLAVLLLRPQRQVLFNLVLMLLVAGAFAVPWWLRNLLFVGNPVYPFVFGGKYWDAFRTAWYTRFGTGLVQRPLELIIVPWTITIRGTQSDLFQGTLGPLLLALLPFNLIPAAADNPQRRAVLRTMWFFVAVSYAIWLLGVAQSNLLWQSRLLFPAFPFLCLLAANGLERLSVLTLPQFSIQRFAAMLVTLVLALTALGYAVSFLSDNALGYFFGGVSRSQYLSTVLGAHYTTAEWMTPNLPANSRVLFLWEPRTYYYSHTPEADAQLDRFAHLVFLYRDADTIAASLRAQGYTHVLLYREGLDNILQTGFDPITPNDVETLNTFVTTHLTPLYGATSFGLETRNGRFGLSNVAQEPYSVYELKP